MQMIYHKFNIRNPEETSHSILVADVVDDFGNVQRLETFIELVNSRGFDAANRFLFPGRYPHLEV